MIFKAKIHLRTTYKTTGEGSASCPAKTRLIAHRTGQNF